MALLLDLVDVPDDTIAADYAVSEGNMTELFSGWLATAESEAELELRRRVARAPVETMHSLLAWLDATEGGAEGYLRSAGRERPPAGRDQGEARRRVASAPAAVTCPGGRHGVCEPLELVRQRLQLAGAAGVPERPTEDPVGEPGLRGSNGPWR